MTDSLLELPFKFELRILYSTIDKNTFLPLPFECCVGTFLSIDPHSMSFSHFELSLVDAFFGDEGAFDIGKDDVTCSGGNDSFVYFLGSDDG